MNKQVISFRTENSRKGFESATGTDRARNEIA